MSSLIRNENYRPTENECVMAINNNLTDYYIIVARGDINITYKMKKAAYESFKRERRNIKNIGNSLPQMSDEWFINTQLQGFSSIPSRYSEPFGHRLK